MSTIPDGSATAAKPRLHILFLNTQNALRADVSVHVSLARALDRQTTRVSVATNAYEFPGDSSRRAFQASPELTLITLELGRPLSASRGRARARSLLANAGALVSVLRLAVWARRSKVDVVHVTERPRDLLFGFMLARLSGAACLVHAHTSYYPHPRSPSTWLYDWVLAHADAVVGVSRSTAESLWRSGPVRQDRVFVVHNAVDSSIFDARVPREMGLEMRRSLGIAADALVIGSVGRLMRGKDQATLLEAFARVKRALPHARLVIAGAASDLAPDGLGGDYRDYLDRRAADLGVADSVVFSGLLPRGTMPELYAAFDIFAHTALEEPFGLVVVEAMAQRVPVVAANAGGVPEIIRGGIDGELVPASDPAATAARVIELASNPVHAAQLAKAGRERVETMFTERGQAATMAAVYCRVFERRSGGPI